MNFKVSQHDPAPDQHGYWAATLTAANGQRVRVWQPESFWRNWAWSIGTDIEVPLVDGKLDLSGITDKFSTLQAAPQIEIERVWGVTSLWVATL